MDIAIPLEAHSSEHRVGLTPKGVRLLVQAGHRCYLQQGAGEGAGFPDTEYEKAGARMVYAAQEVYSRADLVLKVGTLTPDELPFLRGRLNRPTPRLATGLALRGLASAAIDLSDGLGSDLKHICERSGLGATLHADRLPVSPGVAEYIADSGDWALPLSAGDDYELCITVPAERQGELEALAATLPGGLTWIGMMEARAGLRVVLPDGRTTDDIPSGYDHFAND